MTYRIWRPGPPLSHFVAFFWLADGPECGDAKERVLPDGGMQLIISLREDRFRVYDPTVGNDEQRRTGAIVTGPRAEATVINSADVAATLGVCFKPGGAIPFLRMPAHALYGEQVDLETLWSTSVAEQLREQVLSMPTAEAAFHTLENILIGQASWETVAHPAAIFAATALDAAPHTLTLAEVASRVGLSQRRFIEVFRNGLGMTPKRYCRVRRFQAMVERAAHDGNIDWAQVALNCGYFDQAHMIRDFRAFSGLTPSAYMRFRTEHRNHVRLADDAS